MSVYGLTCQNRSGSTPMIVNRSASLARSLTYAVKDWPIADGSRLNLVVHRRWLMSATFSLPVAKDAASNPRPLSGRIPRPSTNPGVTHAPGTCAAASPPST